MMSQLVLKKARPGLTMTGRNAEMKIWSGLAILLALTLSTQADPGQLIEAIERGPNHTLITIKDYRKKQPQRVAPAVVKPEEQVDFRVYDLGEPAPSPPQEPATTGPVPHSPTTSYGFPSYYAPGYGYGYGFGFFPPAFPGQPVVIPPASAQGLPQQRFRPDPLAFPIARPMRAPIPVARPCRY